MVLVPKLLAVASCSTCLASAFIGTPPAYSNGKVRGSAVESATCSRVRAITPQPELNWRASRTSRRRGAEAVPPLLLSSRTVDVDVIDVTDVTEEEARREKEQVTFWCPADSAEHSHECVTALLYLVVLCCPRMLVLPQVYVIS